MIDHDQDNDDDDDLEHEYIWSGVHSNLLLWELWPADRPIWSKASPSNLLQISFSSFLTKQSSTIRKNVNDTRKHTAHISIKKIMKICLENDIFCCTFLKGFYGQDGYGSPSAPVIDSYGSPSSPALPTYQG